MARDREKLRKVQREWMRKRRAEFFAGKVCVKCSADKNLELDHIEPADKLSHCVWSWAKIRREVELAKCQVLCNQCHKAKTQAMYPERQHGTSAMYRRGCRCEPCRAAQAVLWDNWKHKRKSRRRSTVGHSPLERGI
jgi:hypothetical protein